MSLSATSPKASGMKMRRWGIRFWEFLFMLFKHRILAARPGIWWLRKSAGCSRILYIR